MNGSHQAVYSLSQSEVALHCNAISHWLGVYTEWSLSQLQHGWWQWHVYGSRSKHCPLMMFMLMVFVITYETVASCHAAHLRQMSNKICFYGVHCMTKHLGHSCIEYNDSVDIWNRKVICMNSLMCHFIPSVYLTDQGISWFHVKTLICHVLPTHYTPNPM